MNFSRKSQFSRVSLGFALVFAFCSLATLAHANSSLPVKVYVMVGQSNMQGFGAIDGDRPNTLSTIVLKDRESLYQFVTNRGGAWVPRNDVWIHADQGERKIKHGPLKPGYGKNSGSIGPELAFGYKIGDYHDAHVLIVKASWGGKSLGHNFLSPTRGKYPKPKTPKDVGFYYHEVVELVKEATDNIAKYVPKYAGQGYEIAGLCFHQGWNDQYDGHFMYYEKNLKAFINDIRSKEHGLDVPNLPVVIATSGMMGTKTQANAIKMSQMFMGDPKMHPEFAGNVAVVNTSEPYGPDKLQFKFPADESPSNQGYHWNGNAKTHLNIGIAMAAEMQKLDQPKFPSRFSSVSAQRGVKLSWQKGALKPEKIVIARNGKVITNSAPTDKSNFVDAKAPSGVNQYKIDFSFVGGETCTFEITHDDSIKEFTARRTDEGVVLSWVNGGKYRGLMIARGNRLLARSLSPRTTTYTDRRPPSKGVVKYSIKAVKSSMPPVSVEIDLGS